jgi:hypothetical protein
MSIRRSEIQIDQEMDEILRLLVAGATPKQIQKVRNLPERTYFTYYRKLQARIIDLQMSKHTDEIMVDKEIARERLTKALQLEFKLWNDDHVPPRTRMDAGTRYAEITVALLKLETETLGFIHGLKLLQEQHPIELPKEPIREVFGNKTEDFIPPPTGDQVE